MAGRLPAGLTPRLVPIAVAAAYCSLTTAEFRGTVAQKVQPIDIGLDRKELWDIKLIDRWVDQHSGITQDDAHDSRSIEERLNGRD